MYYDLKESGCRILTLRKAGKMTQVELAESLGISLDTLRKLESGRSGTKIDTLLIIAQYFQVSLDYLVTGKEDGTKIDMMLQKCSEKEQRFVYHIVEYMIVNMDLLREPKAKQE